MWISCFVLFFNVHLRLLHLKWAVAASGYLFNLSVLYPKELDYPGTCTIGERNWRAESKWRLTDPRHIDGEEVLYHQLNHRNNNIESTISKQRQPNWNCAWQEKLGSGREKGGISGGALTLVISLQNRMPEIHCYPW